MNKTPRVCVWHVQGDTYRDALRERLPDAPIEAINAATHETGEAVLSAPDSRPGADHAASLIADAMSSAEILLAWKVPPGTLTNMSALRWVQVTGAGVDHFLESTELPATVLVTRSLGRFGIQISEYVVGYLLHHLIGINTYREKQRSHEWARNERPLLADRTVGIIGLGSLGLPTATALTTLGARVLGVRHSGLAVPGIDDVFSATSWRNMLPACDALVIAAPKTVETVGMIDHGALDALPEGTILINISRGELIDEDALLEALESGHLGAAVLDVFDPEPLPEDHPLWDQSRAWITPHIAAPSEIEVIADEFANNYRRYVAGDPLLNAVDRGRGY